jgi:hypothetical protein
LNSPEKLTQETEDSDSMMNSFIKWGREKVWEPRACGLTTDEIVGALKPKQGIKISHGMVHRDLQAKQKEIEGFKTYIEALKTMARIKDQLKDKDDLSDESQNGLKSKTSSSADANVSPSSQEVSQ